ncbi:MAG: ankyrin repeat-containing domain protein [Monoraphidium minutum]|nr:MAG: ankyrin repeat-containing domain protein [Monoraphidium minutum]
MPTFAVQLRLDVHGGAPPRRDHHARAVDTELVDAASRGDAAAARRLLRAGADPCAADCGGRTALYRAACKGAADVVELLLRAGADAWVADVEGRTPLHAAVAQRHPQVALQLIAAHAPLEARSCFGATPLLWAARADDYQARACLPVCKALLEAGADVTSGDDVDGVTALHMAAYCGCAAVIPLLLAAPGGAALLEARSELGYTPLMQACKVWRPAAAKALLAAGADARAAGPWRATALHLALRHKPQKGPAGSTRESMAAWTRLASVAGGREYCLGAVGPYQGALAALLAVGAHAAALDIAGAAPAALAAAAPPALRAKVMQVIVQTTGVPATARLDPHLEAELGRMGAAYAKAVRQLEEAVARLPDGGRSERPYPRKDGPEDPRRAELIAAAAAGAAATVERLLAQPGANACGDAPTRFAPALLAACRAGCAAAVAALLRAGADVNRPGEFQGAAEQCKPLHAAAEKGHAAVIWLLVAGGARVEAHTEDSTTTALWLAADGGHAEAVRALLEAGADPAVRDFQGGLTALHAAARAAAPAAAAAILRDARGGALVGARDKEGRAPLHLAAVGGAGGAPRDGALVDRRAGALQGPTPDPDLVELLLAAGADAAAMDYAGATPLAEARAALEGRGAGAGDRRVAVAEQLASEVDAQLRRDGLGRAVPPPPLGAAARAALAAVVARLEAAAAGGRRREPAGAAAAASGSAAPAAGSARVCCVCGAHQGAGGGKLRACSGCRQRRYCGPDCQKADWKAGHKSQCMVP